MPLKGCDSSGKASTADSYRCRHDKRRLVNRRLPSAGSHPDIPNHAGQQWHSIRLAVHLAEYRFSRNGRCVLLALTLTTQMYALYSFIGSKVASAKSQPPGNNRRFLKWKPNGPACISYHNGDVCRIMFSLDTQHATKAARRKVECHIRKECPGFFLSFVRLRVIFFCVLCAPDFLVVPPLR